MFSSCLWTDWFRVNYCWPRPTRPNDYIHVEVEIVEITPSKTKNDRAIVSYLTQTLNQNREVVLISTTKIVVFKREFSAVSL